MNKMENKLGCGDFLYSRMTNLPMIFQLTVPGFTHLAVHQKINKDMVYTTQQWVADAGTRRGTQGRAEEAGGWRVWATSRWAELCAGIGGGEQVKN